MSQKLKRQTLHVKKENLSQDRINMKKTDLSCKIVNLSYDRKNKLPCIWKFTGCQKGKFMEHEKNSLFEQSELYF